MENTPVSWLRNLAAAFVFALGVAVPGTAMADLITLQLTPQINGDVTVAGYQGAIEVMSLTGEVDNTESIGSGSSGAGAGKPTFGDLMIHKRFDTASPKLFLAVLTGRHFSSAVLTFLKATNGNKLTKTFTITLSQVFVTKFATDATEANVLAGPEQINLTYAKVVLKDEVTGTTACFDRTTNTTC